MPSIQTAFVLCTRHHHSLDLHGLHGLLSSPAFHGLCQPVGSLLLNYDGKFPICIAVSVRRGFVSVFSFYDGKFSICIAVSARRSFVFVFSFYDGKFPIRIAVSVRRSFAFVFSFHDGKIPNSHHSIRSMELCVRLFPFL